MRLLGYANGALIAAIAALVRCTSTANWHESHYLRMAGAICSLGDLLDVAMAFLGDPRPTGRRFLRCVHLLSSTRPVDGFCVQERCRCQNGSVAFLKSIDKEVMTLLAVGVSDVPTRPA